MAENCHTLTLGFDNLDLQFPLNLGQGQLLCQKSRWNLKQFKKEDLASLLVINITSYITIMITSLPSTHKSKENMAYSIELCN